MEKRSVRSIDTSLKNGAGLFELAPFEPWVRNANRRRTYFHLRNPPPYFRCAIYFPDRHRKAGLCRGWTRPASRDFGPHLFASENRFKARSLRSLG